MFCRYMVFGQMTSLNQSKLVIKLVIKQYVSKRYLLLFKTFICSINFVYCEMSIIVKF